MVVKMVVKAEMGVWFAHPFLMKKSFAADRLFGIMELLIGGSNPLRFYRYKVEPPEPPFY